MNKYTHGLIALMALLVAGCVKDIPTEAARSEHDEAMATIVAGALGYESNGLAAMAADMVMAGSGGTLRHPGGTDHTSLIVTQNDSIFDPASLSQSLVLACQRNRSDAYSEWKLHYTIKYAGMQKRGSLEMPVVAVTAETHADGTYRNSLLTVRGTSNGTIRFVKPGEGRSAWLNGEYTWQGVTTFREENERYDDVTVSFAWNRLYVACQPDGLGPSLFGRCDVTIRANGQYGALSKNGSITFDGGEHALLALGGRRYLVSVRTPEHIRET